MGRFKFLALSFLILMCFPLLTYAGNVDTFGIGSKAVALGGAYTAYADGPFAVYYNPAGLTQIKKPMISVGGEIMNPSLKLYNYQATDFAGRKVQPYGKDITDTSPDLFIPFAGFVIPLNDRFTFGFAAYTPYGLHVKFDSNPLVNPGAYNNFESYYMRMVMTPTIAYKISDKLSIGFGVSIGRSYSGSERRLYLPGTYLNNKVIKGTFKDPINYSYNIGILYKPIKQLALGLTYRSEAHTNFTGTVTIVGVQSVGASTVINHPDQVQAGIRYMPTNRLSFEVDFLWTHWGLIDKYTLHFNEPIASLNNIREQTFLRNWKNTKELRFGAEWKATKLLTLRAGYYYDPSPIPTDTFDMVWPDGNKETYSFGAGLNFGRFSVDTAIQYIIASSKRYVRGDSEELNSSYPSTDAPGKVNTEGYGKLWGYSLTLNYKF